MNQIRLDFNGRCITCGAPPECHENLNINTIPLTGECVFGHAHLTKR